MKNKNKLELSHIIYPPCEKKKGENFKIKKEQNYRIKQIPLTLNL